MQNLLRLNFFNRILRAPDDDGKGGGGDDAAAAAAAAAAGKGDDNAAGGAGAGDGGDKSGAGAGGDKSLIDLDGKGSAGERPAYIPEALWDADKKALKEGTTADVLKELETQHKRAEGLRRELGKGTQVAPKTAKEYKLPQLTEEADKSAAALLKADDPFIGELAEAAHEAGMSQKQYENFLTKAARALAKHGDERAAPLTDDQLAAIRDAEFAKIGPNAPRVASAVEGWARGLIAQGHFNPAEVQEIKAMAATADGLRVLNKLRTLTGGESIPMDGGTTVDGLMSDAEIKGLYATPEYNDPQHSGHATMHAKVAKQLDLRQKAGRPTYLQA